MALTKYNPDGFHYWAPQRKPFGGWVCAKSQPDPPQAPDPEKTAAAQTKSNIDTANAQARLNHSNQITPWGSQVWTMGEPGADGTSQWTSTINLSPEQQKLLESSNRISQSMADLGESQLGNVRQTLGTPLNYNSAPSQVTNVKTGPLTTSAGYGSIQNDVDMSKVPGLVGGADLRKTYEDSQKAAYGMQTQYLDKNYGQQNHDLENKLIQQGVLQGSDAWNNEMERLGRQRTFDYNNAFNNSFSTGLQAQSQLYNQGLASNQNAYAQALNNANFHNGAQSQGFGQSFANAQLNNTAQAQAFGQGVTNANLQNQGRTQAINEANYLRQQPLNELNAIRTGSQVTSPQFGSTPQSSVNPTDIAGLYNQQYQGQLANYNAKVAGNNSMTNGLFSLGAAALLAPTGTFSFGPGVIGTGF